MACTSGEEVLSLRAVSLSEQEGAVPLNAIHISAALMRLAKCRLRQCGYAEDVRFARLLSAAEELLNGLSFPQTSHAALPHFNPQDFSHTLYAFAVSWCLCRPQTGCSVLGQASRDMLP
jgi:hypothetical protein